MLRRERCTDVTDVYLIFTQTPRGREETPEALYSCLPENERVAAGEAERQLFRVRGISPDKCGET
jgi:hypothetical protein